MAPNATVAATASIAYGLRTSAHNSVGIAMAATISTPPMVGVPALAWWLSGPSVRMYCFTCMERSRRITHGPSASDRNSDVNVAMAVRTVK
jgi:hypothetical protein